jgi:hypothetical protein
LNWLSILEGPKKTLLFKSNSFCINHVTLFHHLWAFLFQFLRTI